MVANFPVPRIKTVAEKAKIDLDQKYMKEAERLYNFGPIKYTEVYKDILD